MSQRESHIREANELLLNQGKLDVVPQFFAEDWVAHLIPEDLQGREAIVGFVQAVRDAFPDLRVEIEVLVEDGDRVAWVRTARGTHKGNFAGVPPSGREVVWQDMIVTRYEDSVIAEEWAVSGLAGALLAP